MKRKRTSFQIIGRFNFGGLIAHNDDDYFIVFRRNGKYTRVFRFMKNGKGDIVESDDLDELAQEEKNWATISGLTIHAQTFDFKNKGVSFERNELGKQLLRRRNKKRSGLHQHDDAMSGT